MPREQDSYRHKRLSRAHGRLVLPEHIVVRADFASRAPVRAWLQEGREAGRLLKDLCTGLADGTGTV
jgi:hypothetical protein